MKKIIDEIFKDIEKIMKMGGSHEQWYFINIEEYKKMKEKWKQKS